MHLTPEQQDEVFKRWLAGETQVQLATAFGTNQSTISRVCRFKSGRLEGSTPGARQKLAPKRGGARLFVHRSSGQGETPLPRPKNYREFTPGPNPPVISPPPEITVGEAARFWAMVRVIKDEASCWEWDRALSSAGYGSYGQYFPDLKRSQGVPAHRAAWRLTYGAPPDGRKIVVGHRCDNRACVRPDHLFLCTQSENMRDCTTKGRGKQGWRLTWAKVCEIRRLREEQGWTVERLAEKFGVVHSQICNIVNYKQWTKEL